jgi:MFS family permease
MRLLPRLSDVKPYHWLVFLGCWVGGIFDGMDSSLYMVVQHDAIADLAHTASRAEISGIGSAIMATFLLGWTIGGITFGWIGDRFGRVTAMVGSILLYALFTGAAGLAHDPVQLAACRFLVGFGIGGELVTIATMLSETWPETSRAWAVGMLITSYQVGVFLAGLIPTSIYHLVGHTAMDPWRIVFFIGALPAVLAVLLRLRLDEPEAWREQRATDATMAPIMVFGPSAWRVVWGHFMQLFSPAHFRDLFVGGTAFGGLLIGYWASLAWIPTWIQDLPGVSAHGTEKSIATMYHGVAAVFGCGLAGPLANTIGRRWTIVVGYLGAFGATWWLTQFNGVFTPSVYWQDALLGFFIGLGQAVMYIYLPELFPTRIRATAVGFCLNMGRLVTALAVLFVGTLVTWLGGYAMAIALFSCSYLLAAIAGWLGRETKAQALPI